MLVILWRDDGGVGRDLQLRPLAGRSQAAPAKAAALPMRCRELGLS